MFIFLFSITFPFLFSITELIQKKPSINRLFQIFTYWSAISSISFYAYLFLSGKKLWLHISVDNLILPPFFCVHLLRLTFLGFRAMYIASSAKTPINPNVVSWFMLMYYNVATY